MSGKKGQAEESSSRINRTLWRNDMKAIYSGSLLAVLLASLSALHAADVGVNQNFYHWVCDTWDIGSE